MSNNQKVTVTNNFPILGILGLIFITLKLTGYITWSWFWVLSPFWFPLALAIVLYILFILNGVLTIFLKK